MATITTTRPVSTATNFTNGEPNGRAHSATVSVYPDNVESIREREYPNIQDATYLDHAGTTFYAKSAIESFTADLTTHLFGNPHSASTSSHLSSQRITDVRLQALQFFGADPLDYDIVFVSNATAAIKLVADAFRDSSGGFGYGYHLDSHTSLVGVRELANQGSTCFRDDDAVQSWITALQARGRCQPHLQLFAYPGQSNMTGRRLPYRWCHQIRAAAARTGRHVYTLFDAASLASTSPLDFRDPAAAPDFVALSFYKIFGYPDLGALIVRKSSSDVLRKRRYFAGGTVDAISTCHDGQSWHMKKETLHSALEDGTLPFHNIIALGHALTTHVRLFGSMQNVANHTAHLSANLVQRMKELRHGNGQPVCQLYGRDDDVSGSCCGPVVAFNLLDSRGEYVGNSEVEKLGIVQNIQFRTGGLCNPGGIARHLDLSAEEMKDNYAAGHRCGSGHDLVNAKPTGVIRVSFGAMSCQSEVDKFIDFLQDHYTIRSPPQLGEESPRRPTAAPLRFFVESVSVFPIKSCSAFKLPAGVDWEVSRKGLAWDREWCLVHQGTHVALSQKHYPRMALLQPTIDITRRVMLITFHVGSTRQEIEIGLDTSPSVASSLDPCASFTQSNSLVCGEKVSVQIYSQPEINQFFSQAVNVPCALARYIESDTNVRLARLRRPRSQTTAGADGPGVPLSITLSNESPILLVSRSSINRLNEQIRQHRARPPDISPESFRANIVIAERTCGRAESPYAEDLWQHLNIGQGNVLTVLGPCQRCQMVCVDQSNARRRPEPFSTLAKTRRWDGGVWFGIHLCLAGHGENSLSTIRVGDVVVPG